MSMAQYFRLRQDTFEHWRKPLISSQSLEKIGRSISGGNGFWIPKSVAYIAVGLVGFTYGLSGHNNNAPPSLDKIAYWIHASQTALSVIDGQVPQEVNGPYNTQEKINPPQRNRVVRSLKNGGISLGFSVYCTILHTL